MCLMAGKPAKRPILPVLRYPGGKQRLITFLSDYLPTRHWNGRYIEPFVGGAAVFLSLRPRRALLADANTELIDLYRGIKRDPIQVWREYVRFKNTKREYHRIRAMKPESLDIVERSARLLYLNRTCFKGNWRHNLRGQFNVGYGGQSRRWVLTETYLTGVASVLRRATIRCADFEEIVDSAGPNDFLFIDPPYRRGERELIHSHYVPQRFSFGDQERLANTLKRAERRGATWCMTTSNHADIVALYPRSRVVPITSGVQGTPLQGETLVLSKR